MPRNDPFLAPLFTMRAIQINYSSLRGQRQIGTGHKCSDTVSINSGEGNRKCVENQVFLRSYHFFRSVSQIVFKLILIPVLSVLPYFHFAPEKREEKKTFFSVLFFWGEGGGRRDYGD